MLDASHSYATDFEAKDGMTRHLQNPGAVRCSVKSRVLSTFITVCVDVLCLTVMTSATRLSFFFSSRRSGISCGRVRVMAAKAERVFLFSSESVNEGSSVHL